MKEKQQIAFEGMCVKYEALTAEFNKAEAKLKRLVTHLGNIDLARRNLFQSMNDFGFSEKNSEEKNTEISNEKGSIFYEDYKLSQPSTSSLMETLRAAYSASGDTLEEGFFEKFDTKYPEGSKFQ